MTARTAAALSLVLLTGACAVVPEPVTPDERLSQIRQDRQALFQDQEPITGPITLAEAMARAIKYNLDHRLSVMEQALQARQLDVTRWDMLPKLAANAGWVGRTPPNESLSRNTITDFRSVDPSVSQDPSRLTADLSLTWNVLDFGVSYYQAHQQANRVLIAEERRRRIVNSIIQQVRGAFWAAATAERLSAAIDPILEEAEQALADADAIESERLQAPLETLRYQKALIEIIRQLQTVKQDLAIAKAQLAALMNVPLSADFALALPEDFKTALPKVNLGIEEMELIGLTHRPELREEQYQQRIDAAEVKKAMLRILPGLSFTPSLNYDSNSYLIHNAWAEAGVRVTLNLLGFLSGPSAVRAAEAQQEVGEARRLALSMAALTQIHVAYRQYQRALTTYEQARKLDSIEQRIHQNIQAAALNNAESTLERIRSAATAINAELARDRAYADLQNAISSLYVSLGLSPLPDSVESHDLETLTAALAKVAQDWQEGRIRVDPPPEEAGS